MTTFNTEYVPLLVQLRLLADKNGDERSLVAIAAHFERHIDETITSIRSSILNRSHDRNQPKDR